jgi:hypothetical protein
MRHIGIAERRARLGIRHRLADGTQVESPLQATEAVVALHATDPATVHLSALARMVGGEVSAIEEALYEHRCLVRMLGMRRTMFVVPRDLAPVVQTACSRTIAAAQRRKLAKHLADAEVHLDVAGWLADVEESVVGALRARGEATAAELADDEPRLRTALVMAAGKSYEATQNITSRVLFQLAVDGRIVRGRPRGGWTTNNYHWSPMESWLPGGMPELDAGAARIELVRRWLAAFGPAPLSDLKWWTGLGVRELKAALSAIGPVEVDLGNAETGLVLPDDVDRVERPAPWAALLPGLDPTPMGWHQRDWYLGEQVAAAVVDRTGNIGPTVWWDGRVVGGWAQRRNGEIVHRLLEDVGAEGTAAVAEAAAALAAWIGSARVTPRFPAPLDRELTA